MSINCIDVADFSGSINWGKVKAAGVKTAILRSVKKNLITDRMFETNYKAATAAGISVGCYLYTYAKTASYADKEVTALLKLLNGRPMPGGVWLDVETSDLRSASASKVQEIANVYRTRISEAGYTCGVYCDADFYKEKNHFKGWDAGCPFWIASYKGNDGKQHAVPTIAHQLWGHQFSSRGKVSGVSGYVDVSNVYANAGVVPATAPDAGMETLRIGSSGDSVKLIQHAINLHAGETVVEEDGKWGALTDEAFGTFQVSLGLASDRICGKKSWGKVVSILISA